MPLYAGTGKAELVLANRQVYLLNNEHVASGAASVAFLLDRVTRDNFGFTVQVTGSGALEVHVEGSEIDSDEDYVDLGKPDSAQGSPIALRFNQMPRFVRLRVMHSSGPIRAVLTR